MQRTRYDHPFCKRRTSFFFIKTLSLLLTEWPPHTAYLSAAHGFHQQPMSQGTEDDTALDPIFQCVDHFALRSNESASFLGLPSLSYTLVFLFSSARTFLLAAIPPASEDIPSSTLWDQGRGQPQPELFSANISGRHQEPPFRAKNGKFMSHNSGPLGTTD